MSNDAFANIDEGDGRAVTRLATMSGVAEIFVMLMNIGRPMIS